jgi:signal peptidase II
MPPSPNDAVLVVAPRPPVTIQATAATPWSSPLVSFAACATGVAALDLASKQLAAGLLTSHGDVPLTVFGNGVRLAVVLNDQSAFGVSLGPYTWHINLALTLIALVLAVVLCRALSALDSWAPVMLGLIAGAAMGNLVSLIASPKGVLDFIAISSGADHELVFNLADVAAAVGVVLLVRTAWTVGREIARGNR